MVAFPKHRESSTVSSCTVISLARSKGVVLNRTSTGGWTAMRPVKSKLQELGWMEYLDVHILSWNHFNAFLLLLLDGLTIFFRDGSNLPIIHCQVLKWILLKVHLKLYLKKSLGMHTGAVQLVFKHTILCPEVLFKICQIPIKPPIHQSNLYWKSDDYVLEKARMED